VYLAPTPRGSNTNPVMDRFTHLAETAGQGYPEKDATRMMLLPTRQSQEDCYTLTSMEEATLLLSRKMKGKLPLPVEMLCSSNLKGINHAKGNTRVPG
jgi:hypothetical protein